MRAKREDFLGGGSENANVVRCVSGWKCIVHEFGAELGVRRDNFRTLVFPLSFSILSRDLARVAVAVARAK